MELETPKHQPSKSVVFDLSEVDRAVVDVIPTLSVPARWAAINAVRHLNRAWKSREVDPGMACFRLITAEEEATTAVFQSIKQLGYDGSRRLDHHKHQHKNALVPFMDAVRNTVAKVAPDLPAVQFQIDPTKSPPNVNIIFVITDQTGEKHHLLPYPPLNLSTSKSVAGQPWRPEDFEIGIDHMRGDKSIEKFLKERANLRNQILYAGPSGYPEVGGDFVAAHRMYSSNVFRILRVCLLIDQYEKQSFVQQCLYALLKMLKALPKDIDF